jgi:serine/threonine protein phosphatase PrpC
MNTNVSHIWAKGNRPYQEDRSFVNITNDGLLLAVFDGHGGESTAEYCRLNLLKAFNAVADDPIYPTIPNKIRGIFDFLNIETEKMTEGTTASIVFIPSTLDRAFVGVLGDSPVIIKNKDNEYWHSPEHNVRSNPKEVARVKAAGGVVFNGYAFAPGGGFSSAGLQLSRTFGDAEFASILSRDPEIFEIELAKDSFVLVGSDGLFDPSHGSDDAASSIVQLVERGSDAKVLVQYALGIPTQDNVTAILVRIIE